MGTGESGRLPSDGISTCFFIAVQNCTQSLSGLKQHKSFITAPIFCGSRVRARHIRDSLSLLHNGLASLLENVKARG